MIPKHILYMLDNMEQNKLIRGKWMTRWRSVGSSTHLSWSLDIIDQHENKNAGSNYDQYCTYMDDKIWEVFISFLLLDEQLVMV